MTTVDGSDGMRSVDCILSSAWPPAASVARLTERGFSVSSANEYVKTWTRKGCSGVPVRDFAEVSAFREVAALCVEALLLFMIFLMMASSDGLRKTDWRGGAVVALVTALALGVVALSHPLSPPNGLGTYAGKAKLLFESGGIPDAFLNSAGGAVLQPSYPPGLTVLAYLHFVLSGGCGDRLVQMVVVVAMAMLGFALTRRSAGFRGVLPVLVFCLSPVAIRISSGFYAEPFVAMLLVTGWGSLVRGKRFVGALIMGLAGLFRPEAGAVAVAFAFGAACLHGRWSAIPSVVTLSALPAMLWYAFCMSSGFGVPQDWNIGAIPDVGNMIYAAGEVAKAIGSFVVPAALACLMRPPRISGIRREEFVAAVPTALLLLAIPFSCGFYASEHAQWMMDNTIPRLVWYVSAVPLFALLRDE